MREHFSQEVLLAARDEAWRHFADQLLSRETELSPRWAHSLELRDVAISFAESASVAAGKSASFLIRVATTGNRPLSREAGRNVFKHAMILFRELMDLEAIRSSFVNLRNGKAGGRIPSQRQIQKAIRQALACWGDDWKWEILLEIQWRRLLEQEAP